MPDDVAGRLFKHIFSYVNDENPTSDELLLNIAFEPIKQSLKRDLKKWEVRADRSRENGKKGGRPPKIENPQEPTETQQVFSEPRKPDSVSVNGSDSDSVNDSEVKDKRFNFIKSLCEFGFEKDLVADWIKVRKTKKLTNSETAFKELTKEFEKCETENKVLRNDALKLAVTNSWGGFKSDWVKKETKPQNKLPNGITFASPIL